MRRRTRAPRKPNLPEFQAKVIIPAGGSWVTAKSIVQPHAQFPYGNLRKSSNNRRWLSIIMFLKFT